MNVGSNASNEYYLGDNPKENLCRACGNRKPHRLISAREMTVGTRAYYDYMLCDACGSLSILHLPKNLHELYAAYPLGSGTALHSQPIIDTILSKLLFSRLTLLSRAAFNLLHSYRSLSLKAMYPRFTNKNLKILDVGAGNGSFLFDLGHAGFKAVEGIDPYIDSDQNIVRDFKIRKKSIFELNDKYDLIIFNHSFEHFPHLQPVCKKIYELLNPGGHCIIRLPNIESIVFRTFGEHWEGIHAPFHTVLPSKSAIINLMNKEGLDHIESRAEQPYQLLFYSINRIMNIADFEKNGAKKFFIQKHGIKRIPPGFSKIEYKCLRKLSKRLANGSSSEYITHYFCKEICSETYG